MASGTREDTAVTEEQLAELKSWAQSLAEDVRPELRAAARAILLLAEEVERLRGAPELELSQSVAEESEGLRHRLGRLTRPR
jgi:hypothetical protein